MTSDRQTRETEATDYNELLQQHRDYERRLEELNNKSWLTPDEELEEKRIKKLKLKVKDQLAQLSRTAS